MIGLQRLSTCPTVPELLSREADRRAAQWVRQMPAEVWLRPATASVVWDHRNNGVWPAPPVRVAGPRVAGPTDTATAPRYRRSDAVPSALRGRSSKSTPAEAGRREISGLDAWARRRGIEICFVTATFVLASARAANRCGLVSPAGLEHAFGTANQLTRAGMRLWRSSRSVRRT